MHTNKWKTWFNIKNNGCKNSPRPNIEQKGLKTEKCITQRRGLGKMGNVCPQDFLGAAQCVTSAFGGKPQLNLT